MRDSRWLWATNLIGITPDQVGSEQHIRAATTMAPRAGTGPLAGSAAGFGTPSGTAVQQGYDIACVGLWALRIPRRFPLRLPQRLTEETIGDKTAGQRAVLPADADLCD